MWSELPEGWTSAPFSTLATVERGLTYSNDQECDSTDPAAVCVLRIPNVQNQRFIPDDLKYIRGVSQQHLQKYSVPRNAILMVGSNGNADRVGNCCFVEQAESYLYASFLMRVLPDPALADAKFFYYLVAGGDIQSAITDAVAGTTGLKNISLDMLRRYILNMPPLPEQKKIAAILSSVDEAIQATQAVLDQTRRVKEGLLQDLLTRGLGHTRFKQTEIGEIPESWEVGTLGRFLPKGTVQNGLYKPASDYGGGIPIVRIDSYQHGSRVDLTALHRVRLEPSEVLSFGLREADILINRVNSMSHIAKAAIVGTVVEPTVFESNMMRLRLDPDAGLRPHFLILVLALMRSWKHFQLHAKRAIAQASINQQDVASLLLSVPPIREQEEIERIVATAVSAIEYNQQHLDGLVRLKSALLNDLLTGRVRVTP